MDSSRSCSLSHLATHDDPELDKWLELAKFLRKCLERYGESELERTRGLLERCLKNCPPRSAKHFFLLYIKLENEYGMLRYETAVYERATRAVPQEDKLEVFNLYIARAAEVYGPAKRREIYKNAIQALSYNEARAMCQRFADMEIKLDEIERARDVYSQFSQRCDPRVTSEFWQIWKEFEVRHGDKDTMRNMLRIKRKVQTKYKTQANMKSAQMFISASPIAGPVPDLTPCMNNGLLLLALAAEMVENTSISRAGNMFVRGEGIKRSVQAEYDVDHDEEEDEDYIPRKRRRNSHKYLEF